MVVAEGENNARGCEEETLFKNPVPIFIQTINSLINNCVRVEAVIVSEFGFGTSKAVTPTNVMLGVKHPGVVKLKTGWKTETNLV